MSRGTSVRKVLVEIQYEVEPAKRDAYLAHVREMREHATEILRLDYQVFEDLGAPGRFTELFTCPSVEDYETLDDWQDDRFRELVSRLERFTNLDEVSYNAKGILI